MEAEYFKKGDKVRISLFGIERKINPRNQSRTGTVVGFTRNKLYVRVHWDGTKKISPLTYCPDFLSIVNSPG